MIHITGNEDDRYRQEEEHAARRDAEARVYAEVDAEDAAKANTPRCLCCGAPLAKGEYCDGCEAEGLATLDRQNREALASCPNPEETHFIEPEE